MATRSGTYTSGNRELGAGPAVTVYIAMKEPLRLRLDRIDTPIGQLALVVDDAGRLRVANFTDGHSRMERLLKSYSADPRYQLVPASNPGGLSRALRAYFAGDLTAIDGLPVEVLGTPFQAAVWRALCEIPCGETRTYGQIARRIGQPSAVRAVGLANGSNPVGIVVPCHRVIGADGTLTGYGGGIERKRWLLAHERPAARALQLAL